MSIALLAFLDIAGMRNSIYPNNVFMPFGRWFSFLPLATNAHAVCLLPMNFISIHETMTVSTITNLNITSSSTAILLKEVGNITYVIIL